MTPKEKAKELVDKYWSIGEQEWQDTPLTWEEDKQCALIAVNEIIKTLRKDLPEIGLGKGYWYRVKQEIEKL
jgi:hypothetical protein